MTNNKLMAMETELEVLKIRCVVECLKLNMMYEITEIPAKFKEFYELGERLSYLEKEMSDEYKKTN